MRIRQEVYFPIQTVGELENEHPFWVQSPMSFIQKPVKHAHKVHIVGVSERRIFPIERLDGVVLERHPTRGIFELELPSPTFGSDGALSLLQAVGLSIHINAVPTARVCVRTDLDSGPIAFVFVYPHFNVALEVLIRITQTSLGSHRLFGLEGKDTV